MFTPDATVQKWLEGFVQREKGIAGTVHRREGDNLILVAAVNIPPPVVAITATVPKGKGMAGLALERRIPAQTCNLQTDKTGDVRPGAKAVNAQAAIAIPVVEKNGDVRAIVGLAFAHEQELPVELIQKLTAATAGVPV